MTLRNYFLPTSLLILVSFIAVFGQAQSQYDKGTPPQLASGVSSLGSYMSTELGTVNLSNGGLNINVPLGTVGGRGIVAVPLSLSYSSKVWSASMDVDTERESGTEQQVAYADYDNQSSFAGASAPGWTLRTGIYLSVRFVKIKRIMSGPSVGCYTYGLHKLTLNLPDKGEVEFRDDATDGAPLLLNCTTQQTASRGTRWHATDGSGAVFINDVDNGVGMFPSPNLSGTIIFADGTRLGTATNGAIVDRNGNKITFTTNGYTDQLGRNTAIQYTVADPDNPSVTLAALITIPGYQGTPRYYKIKTGIMNQNYRSDINPTLPVITGDWDPEGWGYNWGTATRLYLKSYGLYAQRIDDREVLTEVVLPDGRSLKFRYNEFGEVAEIELPTGGKIQYDYAYRSSLPSGNSPSWETGTNGSGNGIATDVKWVDRAVTSKRTYADGVNLEGTWIFGYTTKVISSVTYPCTEVSVNSNGGTLLSRHRHVFLQAGRYTEPYGSQSLHDGTHYTLWSTGVEWRTESLDAADNVLAASEQDWTQRAPVAWSSYPQEQPAKDNRVNQTRKYFETGMMAKVETFHDQYNNPTEVKEYDYDQTLKRRTVTSYVSTNNGYNYQTDDSIHLLRLPAEQIIYDGSSNQVAKTVTEYDVYTNDGNRSVLTSYPSVSQHDSSYGATKTTRGNPTRIGTWRNTTASFIYTYPRYDVVGNMVSIKDARGNVSSKSFEDDYGNGSNPGTPSQNPGTPTYALPTLITSPPPVAGAPVHTSRSQYDYSTGLLTGFRDRNNVVTQTIYSDPFNRPTLMKSALGIAGVERHAVTYYAPSSTPFGITLTRNDVLTAADQTTLDDANLRSWSVTDGFGRTKEDWTRDPQGNVKVTTKYDALGRTKQVSNPFRPSLSETEVYTTTAYDLLGRVTTVTATDNSVVSTTYDANAVTVTDQALKKRKSITDALGRLTQVYEAPGVAGFDFLTSYQYDALDSLVSVTQGTQTRTFTYNSLKQLLSVTNPESGTLSYQYDDAGNLLVKTDARGVSAHYAYDAFSRVTRRWYNGSNSVSATAHNNPALPAGVGASNEANYFYDVQALPSGAPSFLRGAANGRLVAVTYGTNSSTGDYSGYNSAGRNVLKIQQTGSVNYQMSTAFNIAGATTSLSYPSGRTVSYVYDVAGRTSSMVGNLGDGTSRNYSTELSYASQGGLSKEKFGTSTPVYHKLHYNVRGQLCDVRASNVNDEWGGELGALVNYYSANGVQCGSGSDNNGNLLKSHTIIGSFFVEDRYTYDALNRLTSFSEYQNGTTLTGFQEYEYDRWGNRKIKPTTWGVGINNKQFTVNTANNRLGVPAGQSGTMTYDVAGNLTHDSYTGAGNRTYDAENKITSAWGGNNQAQLYTYDAGGQRIKRTVDGVETWQVYGFGGELLAEYPASGAATSPQKEYGYRNGQLLVTLDAPATPPNGYAFQRAITIDHTKVANADQSNFPVLISGTYSYLATTANGGNVQNPNGYDVIFTSDAGCATKLNHEVETYTATTGAVNYWVKVPVLSHANDTTIYLCYGNSSVTTDQSNKTAVWDANYKGVWHLPNGSTLTASDSTTNGNNGTIAGAVAAAGRTDGSASLNGTSDHVQVKAGKVDTSATTGTVSAWVKVSALDKNGVVLGYGGAAATDPALWAVYIREVSGSYYFAMSSRKTNGGVYNTVKGNTALTTGTWYYVTYSTNGSAWKIRVNGATAQMLTAVLGTNTGDWIGDITATTPDKSDIGGIYTGGSYSSINFWHGTLDEVRLSNVERSDNWVTTEYNNQSSPSTFYTVSSATSLVAPSQVRWLVADHLGTPRMILDQTGTLANVKRHDYLPFGEELFAPAGGRTTAIGYASGDGVRQQFTQKERDIETGLDYFINRYYSAIQGRFTSPDEPFADQQPGDPQSWNLYTYTRNNPLRYTDPDGRGIFDFISDNLQRGFNAIFFGYRVTNAELAAIVEQQRASLISQTASDGLLYIRMGEERMIYALDPRKMRNFEVLHYFDLVNDPNSRSFPLTQELMDNAISLAGSSPAFKNDPYHPENVIKRQTTELAELREKMQSLGREAERLGFGRRIAPQRAPFNSHGQEVFTDGKRFITRDVDSHIGGVWKMFDKAGKRLGTYDANLIRIGP